VKSARSELACARSPQCSRKVHASQRVDTGKASGAQRKTLSTLSYSRATAGNEGASRAGEQRSECAGG